MGSLIISIGDLASLRRLTKKERRGRIVLDFPMLSTDEIQIWEKKLNKLYSHCGCSTGQVFLFLIFIPYLISIPFRYKSPSWSLLSEIALGLVTLIGSAMLGKAVGLRRARRQLKSEVETLVNRLSSNL